MALNKVEKFYAEKHRGEKTAKEIAEDLGKPLRSVNAYLKTLPEPEPERPKVDSDRIANFLVQDGSVAMTGSQATAGDEAKPRNEAFFNTRARNAIFKLDPNKPVR